MADLVNLYQECQNEWMTVLYSDDTHSSIFVYVLISQETFDQLLGTTHFDSDCMIDWEDFPHLEKYFSGFSLVTDDNWDFYPILIDNKVKFGKAIVMVEKKK